MKDIGSFIKQRRKLLALTQNDLAYYCGVTRLTVALWEANKSIPRASNIAPLAKALNCRKEDITELL